MSTLKANVSVTVSGTDNGADVVRHIVDDIAHRDFGDHITVAAAVGGFTEVDSDDVRTIEQIVEAIDLERDWPQYRRNLVYVDYRDSMSPDQVDNVLFGGGWDEDVDD